MFEINRSLIGVQTLCLGYICYGRRTIYLSTIFCTIFFGIVGGYKLRRMRLHCLRSPYDFFRRQTRTKPYRDLADIVRQPQGYRTIITLSSRPPYKSHDARTMTLQKSQGVGTLTVQLSCYYVHGFKRLSMFIFAFHLNYIMITSRAMKRLVFLVEQGPKI